MDGYITVDEAASIQDVHPNTIRNYIKAGKLPNTFKKGHIVLVYESDLEQLQKEAS